MREYSLNQLRRQRVRPMQRPIISAIRLALPEYMRNSDQHSIWAAGLRQYQYRGSLNAALLGREDADPYIATRLVDKVENVSRVACLERRHEG